MVPLLKQQGLTVGKDVFLCFSPERVDPGNETWHTNNTPKVIGGLMQECEELAAIVYGKFIDRMLPVSSPEARSSPSSWIASSA
jgi:UDP-N-acetyl-D-glucosamine dehydrogenase